MELNTKTPEYWWSDGTLVVFNKYYLDKNDHIVNKATNKPLAYYKNKNNYYSCKVRNDKGVRYNINIARMLASTYRGKPPTSEHTADHINRKRDDDRVENIRWATKSEQCANQDRLETRKSAFIITRGEVEKTVTEWVCHLKNETNTFGREYTSHMINHYARRKQFGFSYKEYPDLPGEEWLEIGESKNSRGYWKISDMNRVKWITKHAEHLFSGELLGVNHGYPVIGINGKNWFCHILSYKTFFPQNYASRQCGDIILHENDDRTDFRPHKLRIGTVEENAVDAHNNGSYCGTKSSRKRCTSYINGIREKDYESQSDAVKYLISVGFEKASRNRIREAVNKEGRFAYGRTWKLIP